MQEQLNDKVSLEEFFQALMDCLENKKNTDGAKKFTAYAFHNLCNLVDEINCRRYVPKRSDCFVVKYPVPREVFCAAFRDRIVQHFVYNELNPVIERLLIQDTCSCRTGKGTDYAIQRVQTFVRKETDNWTDIDNVYYAKLDISGFFMSMDRQRVLSDMLFIVDHIYKGPHKEVLRYLLPIIILTDVTKNANRLSPLSDWDLIPARKSLFGNDKGLPIGNITSQLFANFYLNRLDHIMKHRHSSYVRYVDDIIIVDKDRKKLEQSIVMARNILSTLGMRLNEKKTIISKVKYGIPFLGVRIYPFYTIIGKKKVSRLYYTTRKFPDIEKAFSSVSCRRGMFIRYKGKRLSERWYASLPEEYKEKMKMETGAKFVLVNRPCTNNKTLRSIRLYGNGKGDRDEEVYHQGKRCGLAAV